MAEKREFSSGGTVNEFRPIDTTSQTLNCQDNLGGVKPKMRGDYNPPDAPRPKRAPEQAVPMPYPRAKG